MYGIGRVVTNASDVCRWSNMPNKIDMIRRKRLISRCALQRSSLCLSNYFNRNCFTRQPSFKTKVSVGLLSEYLNFFFSSSTKWLILIAHICPKSFKCKAGNYYRSTSLTSSPIFFSSIFDRTLLG